MPNPEFQPNFEEGRSYVVSGGLLNALIRQMLSSKLVAGAGIELTEQPNGTIIRSLATAGAGTIGGGFCEIFEDDGDWYIRGGAITAGADSHQIDDFQFSVATDADYLVWIDIDVVANTADDVLLPGLESSSGAAIVTGASYPDADIPEAPTGNGTAIIPLGRMVIVDGVPTFSPAGNCSPIQVGHCPGSLTY